MHGHHEHSRAPRLVNSLVHAAAIVGAGWLLTRDGHLSTRDLALLACSAIYFARAALGMFVMLKRRFAWSEAAIVGSLFVGVHLGFAHLGSAASPSLDAVAIAGLILYAVGSYLNTASEYGRLVWKRDPANTGRLYREGLFRHSMHINYFGDSVLFTGFALVTGSAWALIVPGVMTLGFVFQHIPTLDAYLARRYGPQYEAYARTTKKFVPYVY